MLGFVRNRAVGTVLQLPRLNSGGNAAQKEKGAVMSTPVLISLNEVCRRTSLSRTQVNNYRNQGRFPAAVSLGDKRIAFVASEVDQWISERIAAREAA